MQISTSSPKTAEKILHIALPLIFWLGLWWLLAACINQELLVPSPLAVAQKLAALVVTAHFWYSVAVSLLRIFCGALSGVVLGSLCAVITCRWPLADYLLSPAIRVIRATPVASFIILILLWIHTGKVPGVIAALMVLPIMWESVSTGIRSTKPALLEFARAYQLSRRQTALHVYLPAIQPFFAAGICTSIGLAWKSGVAAEVLCLPRAAIGAEVYYAKIYLETPSLFAWTITVIVLSLLVERLVRRLLAIRPTNQGGSKL